MAKPLGARAGDMGKPVPAAADTGFFMYRKGEAENQFQCFSIRWFNLVL